MAKKIVTFSIDDGTLDDFKVVEIMNRYGIKGTFNINSGRMGTGGIFRQHDTDIKHYRVKEEDYASLYSGHEIACHTVNHKNLTLLDEHSRRTRKCCTQKKRKMRLSASAKCLRNISGR